MSTKLSKEFLTKKGVNYFKIYTSVPTYVNDEQKTYYDSVNMQFLSELEKNYTQYHPKEKTISQLKQLNSDIKIKIIGGAWCSDTRLQVSRFIRILDEIQFEPKNLNYIGVDKTKKSFFYGQIDKDIIISKVPLILIYNNSKNLIGSIIETPKKTLEEDFYKILNR